MSFWELPIPPVWWWLLVGGIILLFTYFWKRTLEDMEKEDVPTSPKEKRQQRITRLKISEVAAWTLMPVGLIIYAYGIMELSPFAVFLVASLLIVISFVAGRHYRNKRLECQRELERQE